MAPIRATFQSPAEPPVHSRGTPRRALQKPSISGETPGSDERPEGLPAPLEGPHLLCPWKVFLPRSHLVALGGWQERVPRPPSPRGTQPGALLLGSPVPSTPRARGASPRGGVLDPDPSTGQKAAWFKQGHKGVFEKGEKGHGLPQASGSRWLRAPLETAALGTETLRRPAGCCSVRAVVGRSKPRGRKGAPGPRRDSGRSEIYSRADPGGPRLTSAFCSHPASCVGLGLKVLSVALGHMGSGRSRGSRGAASTTCLTRGQADGGRRGFPFLPSGLEEPEPVSQPAAAAPTPT